MNGQQLLIPDYLSSAVLLPKFMQWAFVWLEPNNKRHWSTDEITKSDRVTVKTSKLL